MQILINLTINILIMKKTKSFTVYFRHFYYLFLLHSMDLEQIL